MSGMVITLNGSQTEIDPWISVQRLIEQHKLNPAVVVVELNGTILKQEQWAQIMLAHGDQIELVSFVGGG